MKVFIIAASTICGRIDPISPGSQIDRKFLERMRDQTGASLIGAATLRDGDPEFRGTGGNIPAKRIRAIITQSADIFQTPKNIFISAPPPLIFAAEKKVAALQKKIGKAGEVFGLPAGPSGLSIQRAIDELKKRTSGDILIEGGGRLNYAALKAGVVDEIYLTICPRISGHQAAAAMASGPQPLGMPFVDLKLIDVKVEDNTGEIFARYRLK